MTSWDDLLNPFTQTRTTGTKAQPKTPAVIRKGDVFKTAFESVPSVVKPPEPGGWKGFVSDVLGSPIGKALTEVGSAIALPGRAVVGVIEEARDALDNDPNTKASWGDFTKNVTDESYGFGSLIGDATGNKLIDRILGFAGDVLLDPTTYLTLGGSKALKAMDEAGNLLDGTKALRVAGAEGRINLAKRVLERTGDSSLAQRVARYGRSAIKDADVFEKIGLDRAGLYFMGKRLKGTGKVGEVLEGGITSMRTWSGDHLFKRASELFSPLDAKAARKALLTGTGSPENVGDYLYMVLSANKQRAVAGASGREAAGEVQQLVTKYGADNLKQHSGVVRDILEKGAVVADEAADTSIPMQIARDMQAWFKGKWTNVRAALDEFEPDAPLGEITDYFPHSPTDRASRMLADASESRLKGIRESIYNPLDNAGSFKHRLQEGDEFFGYTLTKEDVDGGVTRLNEIARKEGNIDFDFFETDITTVMAKYVDQYAQQMGIIARKKYLVDKNVLKKLEERLYIDEDMWKDARKRVTKVTKERATATKNSSKVLDDTLRQVDTLLKKAESVPGAQIERINNVARATLKESANARQAVYLAKQGLKAAYDNLAVQRGVLSGLFEEGAPKLVRMLEAQLEDIVTQIEKLSSEIGNLEMGREYALGRIRAIQREIEALNARETLLTQYGEVIERNLDNIIAGKDVEGFDTLGKAVRAGMQPDTSVAGGRELLISGGVIPTEADKPWFNSLKNRIKSGDVGGEAGTWTADKQKMLEAEFTRQGGKSRITREGVVNSDWWKNANEVAGVTAREVIDMNREKISDVISKAVRGEANIHEMRVAALAIASNGSDIPPDLWDAMFAKNTGVMARASRSEAFFNAIDKMGAKKNRFMKIKTMSSNAVKVQDDVAKDLSVYAAANGMLRYIFNIAFDDNSIISSETLSKIFDQQPQFAPLRDVFAEFVGDPNDLITRAYNQATEIGDDLVESQFYDIGQEASILGLVGGRQVGRDVPELTFREFVGVLRGIVEDAEGGLKVHTVDFTPEGPAKFLKQGAEVPVSKSYKINIADYTGDIGAMVDNGEDWNAIVDRIESIVYGSGQELPPLTKTKGVNRVQYIRGQGIEGRGAEAGFTGGVKQDNLASIRSEIRDFTRELNSEEFAAFRDSKPVFEDASGNISSLYVDFAGKRMSVTEKAAQEATDELSSTITELWFRSEVSARFAKTIETLQPFGIVPTQDYLRRIVNEVAKEHAASVSKELDDMSYITTRLESLIGEVNKSMRTYADEPRKLEQEINAIISGRGEVIRRHAGRADASDLRERWIAVGGARPSGTGEVKKINAARRVVASNTATAEEKARAQAFIDGSRSIDDLFLERERIYNYEVVPWYKSNFGRAPRNRMEANNALRELASMQRANGRLGGDATASEMKKWMETVVAGLNESSRNNRRSRLWLVQAADPFVDVNSMRIGRIRTGVSRQDVPSMYAAALRNYADMYQRQATDLAASVKTAAAATTKAVDAIPSAELGQSIVDVLGSGSRRDLFALAQESRLSSPFGEIDLEELNRARIAYQKYVEMLNSPDYLAAVERSDLNDLLLMMAGREINRDTVVPLAKSRTKVASEIMASGGYIYQVVPGNKRMKYALANNSKEVFANGENLYVLAPGAGRNKNYEKLVPENPEAFAKLTPDEQYKQLVAQAKRRGSSMYVGEWIGKPDSYVRVKSPSDLYDTGEYRVFTPYEGVNTPASVEATMKRVSDNKARIISLRKEARDIAENKNAWYKDRVENADIRDLDARRKATAALKDDERRIVELRDEADALERQTGQLQVGIDNSMSTLNARISTVEQTALVYPDVPPGPRDIVPMPKTVSKSITFSPAEYRSLYMDPAERGKLLENNKWLLSQKKAATTKRVAALQKKIDELAAGVNAGRISLDEFAARTRPYWSEMNTIKDELAISIRKIEQEIEALQPGIQQMALQKAHTILQMAKSGDINFDELERGMTKQFGQAADLSVVARRKSVLNKLWEESSDSKVINEVERYGNSFQVNLASSISATGEGLVDHARKLKNAADEAWGVFSDAKAPYGFTEAGQIRDVPVVGVVGARRRLSEADETLRNSLTNLSKATQNQVDAVARFDLLTDGGMSATKAIDQIIEEVRQLVPKGTKYIDSARELAQIAARRSELLDEGGFFRSQVFDIAGRLWGDAPVGRGYDLKKTREVLVDRAEKLRAEFDKVRAEWQGSQDELISWAEYKYTDAEKRLLKAEFEYTQASIIFDQTKAQRMRLEDWYKATVPPLRAKRDNIVNALDVIAKRMEGAPNGDFKMAELLNWLEEYDDFLYDALSPDDYTAIRRLKSDAMAAHEFSLNATDKLRDAQDAFRGIENLEWGVIVEREASKGWEKLTSIDLPSYQARKEIAAMVQNFSRIREPEFVRSLNKVIGSYTGFFKAYTTATPGFVVRNTMSNMFSLVAAGASPKRMGEGLGLFREWQRALKTNSVEGWLESLGAAKRARVETAIAVMDASGYGKAGEAFALFKPDRKWLVENKYIKAFRNANEMSENSARFMLAWDSVVKGGDFDASTARVRRFLFDYQNVSTADQTLRAIIPFWFWMSRNLPLQLTNQWSNPRAYNIYNNAMQNIGADQEEDPFLPLWMREQGATRIGGDFYLMPDVGTSRIQQDLQMLGDPMRFLSDVNPALRLPLELLGGRKLYNATEFSDRGREATGGVLSPAVQTLANLLGQDKILPDGGQGVSDKMNWAVNSLIPIFGQSERLLPTTDYGKEKALTSRLSWLGVPIREVTQTQRESEQRRQRRESGR